MTGIREEGMAAKKMKAPAKRKAARKKPGPQSAKFCPGKKSKKKK